jgi:hypothetical protein
MQYLDKAMMAPRGLGVVRPDPSADESPITGWLGRVLPLDENRVVLIARVLNQAGNFNEGCASRYAACK